MNTTKIPILGKETSNYAELLNLTVMGVATLYSIDTCIHTNIEWRVVCIVKFLEEHNMEIHFNSTNARVNKFKNSQ